MPIVSVILTSFNHGKYVARRFMTRVSRIGYEDFCRAPEDVFLRIKKILDDEQALAYCGPTNFDPSRKPDSGLAAVVNRAHEFFEQRRIASADFSNIQRN